MRDLQLWIFQLSNALAVVVMVLLVAGLVLHFMPTYKSPRLAELGTWTLAAAAVLATLAVAATAALISPVVGVGIVVVTLLYIGYWVPASRRDVSVSIEGTVAAPPEAAFALATDVSAEARLLPWVLSARIEDGGPLRLGSRVVRRIRLTTRGEAVDEIVDYDPPRRLSMHTLHGSPGNLETMTFVPTSDGTVIRCASRSTISIPAALWLGPWKRRLSKTVLEMRTDWFQALRHELEGGGWEPQPFPP